MLKFFRAARSAHHRRKADELADQIIAHIDEHHFTDAAMTAREPMWEARFRHLDRIAELT